jgi:hypothetical protein
MKKSALRMSKITQEVENLEKISNAKQRIQDMNSNTKRYTKDEGANLILSNIDKNEGGYFILEKNEFLSKHEHIEFCEYNIYENLNK